MWAVSEREAGLGDGETGVGMTSSGLTRLVCLYLTRSIHTLPSFSNLTLAPAATQYPWLCVLTGEACAEVMRVYPETWLVLALLGKGGSVQSGPSRQTTTALPQYSPKTISRFCAGSFGVGLPGQHAKSFVHRPTPCILFPQRGANYAEEM